MIALLYRSLFRHLGTCVGMPVALISSLLVPTTTRAQSTGAPSAAFMFPSSATAGDAGTTLMLTGAGFVTGSTIHFGTQVLTTNIFSVNQLSAVITAQHLATAGQFPVLVVNPNGTVSNSLTFNVNAPPIAITTTALPAAPAGAAYSQRLVASGGAPPYTWTADALPPGLTLTSAGQLTGTPAALGNFTFTIRVTDSSQRTGTRVMMLAVIAPVITITTGANLQPGTEGGQYRQTLVAENGTPPLRWSTGPGLPPGITLDATGVLHGTPVTRGTYSFTVQVTDAANAATTKTFTLAVQAASLTITTVSPLFSGFSGSAYSQTFAGSGGAPPYAWSMTPQVSGLALDRINGVLAGTPEQPGTYTLTVQLTDSTGANTAKTFSFMVEQPQLRIDTGSQLPSGAVGTAYQQRLLASGGKQPFIWAVTSGVVPGVSLDPSTGVLSGTPNTSGTFTVTAAVRDERGATASRVFTLAIAPGPLRLTPLPDALQSTAGEPFSASMLALGGTSPYTWSTEGLPEGLQINDNGQISGVPLTPGSFQFAVRVSDSDRATVAELFNLQVKAPAVPALTISGLPAVSKTADQVTFRLQLASPYALPLSGQLSLLFLSDAGVDDSAIQFSTGGRTLAFRIPAGTTDAEFSAGVVGLQTGTVAGTITLLLQMQTSGVNLTPTHSTLHSIGIERSSPTITSASFNRTSSAIEMRITGYSTAREVTQGVFRFRAAPGSSLTTSEITLPLEDMFGRWFRDSESAQHGGRFTFTQQFAVQGDANAVTPVSVTLTNRLGSTTFDIQ